MNVQPFRIQPKMPAASYVTYGIARPLATNWRPATCEEVGCQAFENGWVTLVDEKSELGQAQAHYIRRNSKRKFTQECTPEGLTRFSFPAGQNCFRVAEHRAPLERPVRYYVRAGDWRGNPRGTPVYTHKYAEDWIEDFSEHQDALKTAFERG